MSKLSRKVALLLALALLAPVPALPASSAPAAYLGFDRNDYPGDSKLSALRRTFAFTGYWLNNPPGERANSWRGKRATIEAAGFGFLLLFNGRDYAQLISRRDPSHAARLGAAEGASAAHAARAEGFPPGSVIFLDQEQGGRMLPEQKQYVFAWARAVREGGFRPGIYCSGIEVAESGGGHISTARDLHDWPEGRELVFWVANDACPPSPGCAFPAPGRVPLPEASGVPFAEVWQYAQSPVRRQFASGCLATYNADGNCYPPSNAGRLHLDINTARTSDPSHAVRAGSPSGYSAMPPFFPPEPGEKTRNVLHELSRISVPIRGFHRNQ
jgi:hypothetical protein